MRYNKLAKTMAVVTTIAALGGFVFLGTACKNERKKEENIKPSATAEESSSELEEAVNKDVIVLSEEDQQKLADYDNLLEENECLEFKLRAKNYAIGRADNRFFLSYDEVKYMMDDINKNEENSKYWSVLEILSRSGAYKYDDRLNTPEKLKGMFNQALDGDVCNYEFRDDYIPEGLYEYNWAENAAMGYQEHCCDALVGIEQYLGCKAEEDVIPISTETDCIDVLPDSDIIKNAFIELIYDYAVANKEKSLPVIEKFEANQPAFNSYQNSNSSEDCGCN